MLTHRDLPVPAGADVRLTHADVRDVHGEMTAVADDHSVFSGWLDLELVDVARNRAFMCGPYRVRRPSA